MARSLTEILEASAARFPSRVAVEDAAGSVTYAELDALSDRARDRFRALGLHRGDRMGVCLDKSIDAYAAILGAMKAGAAYVPLDVSAPAWRRGFVSHDCALTLMVIDRSQAAEWREATGRFGPVPSVFELDGTGGGQALCRALDAADSAAPAPAAASEALCGDDLAYILYTSGSTGTPKGVMISHAGATHFVDWCSSTFDPRPEDRFSSHAPLHFDLSILDLYVPLAHGAAVVLIAADQGKEPVGLARLISERRLTVWYSTPTVLSVLAQFGKMHRHDFSAVRLVLFAGEVFPVKHLRAVMRLWPTARFFNLYGPTETNVCTWQPIPAVVDDGRTEPFPIGRACAHYRSRVVDERGRDVPCGTPGELVVQGDGMMRGYWNQPERTAEAFLSDDDGRWYRTGDTVTQDADGVLSFVGRRDRMVKRRGYRIELGDIEAGLYRHGAVREAAVVALEDPQGGIRLKAYLTLANGHPRSEVAMRQFCAEALPGYMIPDGFGFLDALPKTSTDKVDYERLRQLR
jgi:amino acid adenylation domain-containing protein